MVKSTGKFILLAIMFCATLLCKAQDNVIDKIIWVVGDEAILKSDVEEARIEMTIRGEKLQGDPYCFIPEQLAVQKLFLDQAKVDSISMPTSDLSREVNRQENFLVNNVGGKEKLEEYWKMPISQIRERLREQLQTRYLVTEAKRKIIGKKSSLTPSEVRKFYSQLPKDSLPYIPTTVEVQIITNEPVIPVTEIDRIKEQLRDFTDRVGKGESFSTLAIMYSEDGSAVNGGETGFYGRAQWVPEFSNMAFSLSDPKKVSNIVETEYGFHIIQLIERRGDQVNVRHILLRPKVPAEAFSTSITRVDSLVNFIRDGRLTFEDAASIASYDKDTRNNNGLMANKDMESSNYGTPRFSMEELPNEVAKVIDTMKVGDISAPFKMRMQSNHKEVVAVVKLRTRIDRHVANVSDDYQALKGLVESRKEEEILKKWLQNKIKNTYIYIDENWRNCDFQYSGWVK